MTGRLAPLATAGVLLVGCATLTPTQTDDLAAFDVCSTPHDAVQRDLHVDVCHFLAEGLSLPVVVGVLEAVVVLGGTTAPQGRRVSAVALAAADRLPGIRQCLTARGYVLPPALRPAR